jgi:hypothetical protein
MPHASLKLIPGVDVNKTPALNEMAISDCQLIRFIPDRTGIGLVQKLGGWQKFYPNTLPSTIKALHAWQDNNQSQDKIQLQQVNSQCQKQLLQLTLIKY